MANTLEELYEAYKDGIYNYLYRSTLNNHIAEELTQDTFLKAFKSIGKFRGESSIKTWLYTIARNTYINSIKKKQYQLEEDRDFTAIEVQDPSDEYSSSDEKMIIRKILLELPEKWRTLIILRHHNGLSYKDISSILHISEGQVKIGLHRAKKRFKELYENHREG